MRQDEHDPLPLRLDPEAAAGEAGVPEGRGRERRSARAGVALARPAEGVGPLAGERAIDRCAGQQALRTEPLPPQRQHLLRGHEEPGVAGEAAERPRIPVLRHAAQEGRLPREFHSLGGGEIDLFPVVEPAFDRSLRRRMPGESAERREAERTGDVQVEEIGEVPAGRLLRREAPEDVAEIAVDRGLEGCAAGPGPEAFAEEKLGELPVVGEALSQACCQRCPGGDPRPVTQEILERRLPDPGAGGGKQGPDGAVEPELALRRESERQGRDPRLGERCGVEARPRQQPLASDPIAGGMAEANLAGIRDQHLDRTHRAAEAGEIVEVGRKLPLQRLTVGHRNRILP